MQNGLSRILSMTPTCRSHFFLLQYYTNIFDLQIFKIAFFRIRQIIYIFAVVFLQNMTESIFKLEDVDPTIFLGVNNENVVLLKNLYPKLQIHSRGCVVKVSGSEEDVSAFENAMLKMQKYCADYNRLTSEIIVSIARGNAIEELKPDDNLILFGMNGKPIVARTKNQQKLVKEFDKCDLLFAIGPAGSGKTYTAIALAVKALKSKEVKKIILSRPAVEAGEKLGFLPGDMKEKIDPYLQPLYDALQDMIPGAKLKEHLENGVIQIAPLAFMRGRTLNDAIVILDEAQNTTTQQIKMFLTRMGMHSKMIVTGDMTQIDLPSSQKSGLRDALEVLHNIKGIAKIEFDKGDIVRHRLVQRIVEAYDKRNRDLKTATSNN